MYFFSSFSFVRGNGVGGRGQEVVGRGIWRWGVGGRGALWSGVVDGRRGK